MATLRNGTAGLALALALVPLGGAGPPGAGEAPKEAGKPARKMTGILVPAALEGRLNLDAAQREKIAKLEAEFKQRRQGIVLMTGLKLKGVLDRLDDPDAVEAMPALTIAGEVTTVLQKLRKARLEFEGKVGELLNDEQRAQLRAWQTRTPREKRAERKGKRLGGDGPRQPVPDYDRELRLTPEQHKKLAEMERDWEARFRRLLTPEQRRRYDELSGAEKKGAAPGAEKAPAPK